MPFSSSLLEKAAALLATCRQNHHTLVTAESCTGGLLAALLTEIPGASDILERGFITYSNAAKTELLGVPESLIARYGAVSKETALAMAEGALAASRADISIAITGIAGPDGGSLEKPVGLVHFAIASKEKHPLAIQEVFSGNRSIIRIAAIEKAVALLIVAAAS